MTKLVFIGGPMGVGKSTITQALCSKFSHSVMLDGDWCWFQGDKEWDFSTTNKKMVLENITFLLNSFLKTKSFDFIFFCWVLHEKNIEQEILSRLNRPFDFYHFSLICEEKVLKNRILNRQNLLTQQQKEEQIKRALQRLKQIETLDTIKINTSFQTFQETTLEIGERLNEF